MAPGVVQLGILAVLFQVIIIAGFYSYLRWRYPIPDAELRPRTKSLLLSGLVLVTFGQLAAFGAIGSLRVASVFSVRQAIRIQNAGFLVTFLGYGVLVVGFALYPRKSD